MLVFMPTAPQLPRAAGKFATSYREFAVLTPHCAGPSADTSRLAPSGSKRISQQCRVSKLLNLHNVNMSARSPVQVSVWTPLKLLSLSQGQECCLCAVREAAAAQPSQPSPAQPSPAAHMCHHTSRRYVTSSQPSPAQQPVSGIGATLALPTPHITVTFSTTHCSANCGHRVNIGCCCVETLQCRVAAGGAQWSVFCKQAENGAKQTNHILTWILNSNKNC